MGYRERPGDQPLPVPNGSVDVQFMVIADIEARRELGIRRYGTALQPHNGRDALRDAYEEALDLACYLRQAIAERDGGRPAKRGVRYWVLISRQLLDDQDFRPRLAECGARLVELGAWQDRAFRWVLVEDDGAPPELEGAEVELVFTRGRRYEKDPDETTWISERKVTGAVPHPLPEHAQGCALMFPHAPGECRPAEGAAMLWAS